MPRRREGAKEAETAQGDRETVRTT